MYNFEVVGHLQRRPLLLGFGTLTASVVPANRPLKAEGIYSCAYCFLLYMNYLCTLEIEVNPNLHGFYDLRLFYLNFERKY